MASNDSSFVLLHPDDDVLVCCRAAALGDEVVIDGCSYTLPNAVAVGHKISRRDLTPGDTVLKHGAPIGSMTAAAAPSDHVHAHNLRSDYISTHTREGTTASGDRDAAA